MHPFFISPDAAIGPPLADVKRICERAVHARMQTIYYYLWKRGQRAWLGDSQEQDWPEKTIVDPGMGCDSDNVDPPLDRAFSQIP